MDTADPVSDSQILHAPVQNNPRHAIIVYLDLDVTPGCSPLGNASERLDERFPGGETNRVMLRAVPFPLTVIDLGPGKDVISEPAILPDELPLHAFHVKDVATDSEDLGDRVPGLLGF